MDQLPLEMVLELSRHLTDRDVNACSAVCRAWWELFNYDVIWKPRCSLPEREEYLRTTPSLVEPTFPDSMESDDTTLSAPCQWRLARLREEHLRNNWRHGRRLHRTMESYMKSAELSHLIGFLTDDVVFIVYKKHLDLYDVSVEPTVKVADISLGFTLSFRQIKTIKFIGENQFILATNSHVEVYDVNIQVKTISLKFKFRLAADTNDLDVVIKYVVIGIVLVALVIGGGRLHVWDLASGNKLKEHDVDAGSILVGVVGSETSDYVAINSSSCIQNEFLILKYSYSLYSTKTLSFVQFLYELEHESIRTHLHTCAVHKQFIALRVDQHTLVYDFNSCSLLFKGCHGLNEPWNIEIVNNAFVFTQNGKLMTYNPVTNSQTIFDIAHRFYGGEHVIGFDDLKFNFMRVISDHNFTSLVFELSENGLVKVDLSVEHETFTPIETNKSRSRMLYHKALEYCEIEWAIAHRYYVHASVLRIISFW